MELLTGSLSGNMKLEVYDRDNKLVCKLDNDNALLGSYPIDDGMRIHVSLQRSFDVHICMKFSKTHYLKYY